MHLVDYSEEPCYCVDGISLAGHIHLQWLFPKTLWLGHSTGLPLG